MTMSISLNREETIRIADLIGLDKALITSGKITSLTIYGDLRVEKENKNDAE